MDTVPTCSGCGGGLQAPVRFCPFCGLRQGAAAADLPEPAPAPAPAPPMPATPATPPVPSPAPTGADARRPIVPPVAPAPAQDTAARWNRGRATPTAPTPRSRPAVQGRQARRDRQLGRAARRLAAAAFVLVCAAILWRQMVAGPHGTLLVRLSRPADGPVLVDGIASGMPDSPIAVSPGRHSIGLRAPGFDTPERSVIVMNGERRVLSLSPVPAAVTLLLDTVPAGAAIAIDGHPAGRAPLERLVRPGRIRVVASLPGYAAAERMLVVQPGDAPHLSLVLQPLPPRTLRLQAPAGRWSAPVALAPGGRFTLLFRGAIRVRIAGRVVLLQPGDPVELGAADATGLSVTAAGADPVPVQLLAAAPQQDAD